MTVMVWYRAPELGREGGTEIDWPVPAAEANWGWIGEFLAREWGVAAVELTAVEEVAS